MVNGATTWAFQDSNVFDNLPAATTYVVTGRMLNYVRKTLGATVDTPTPLSATSSITAKLLCTTNNDPTKGL